MASKKQDQIKEKENPVNLKKINQILAFKITMINMFKTINKNKFIRILNLYKAEKENTKLYLYFCKNKITES